MENVAYVQEETPVMALGIDARATFINKTYMHLLGAILGFTFIELFLFSSGAAERIAQTLLSVNWLFVLGGFMIVSWLASHAAHSSRSIQIQYLSLIGFVAAESIIFVPLLYVAQKYAPGVIQSAALVTLMGFFGLTAVAFVTRKDFSFLTSLMGLTRIVANAPTGYMVTFLGWPLFYTISVLGAVPAILLLPKFAPWKATHKETKNIF